MSERLRLARQATFRSFSSRNFRLFFGGQLISQAGTWMQSVAIIWLVLDLTGSGIALAHPDDSDTETGYNLFFGLSTAAPEQRTRGFLEFRWTFVNDTSPFRLALGFLYRL